MLRSSCLCFSNCLMLLIFCSIYILFITISYRVSLIVFVHVFISCAMCVMSFSSRLFSLSPSCSTFRQLWWAPWILMSYSCIFCFILSILSWYSAYLASFFFPLFLQSSFLSIDLSSPSNYLFFAELMLLLYDSELLSVHCHMFEFPLSFVFGISTTLVGSLDFDVIFVYFLLYLVNLILVLCIPCFIFFSSIPPVVLPVYRSFLSIELSLFRRAHASSIRLRTAQCPLSHV